MIWQTKGKKANKNKQIYCCCSQFGSRTRCNLLQSPDMLRKKSQPQNWKWIVNLQSSARSMQNIIENWKQHSIDCDWCSKKLCNCLTYQAANFFLVFCFNETSISDRGRFQRSLSKCWNYRRDLCGFVQFPDSMKSFRRTLICNQDKND